MKELAPFLYIVGLGCLYGVGYYLNHKTPVPKGCENLKADCEGCKITSCENHPIYDLSKGEKI